MAKFKWRLTDRLPLSYQAAFLVFGLVMMFSTASFHMLPKSRIWGNNFSTLLMDVATSFRDSTATAASLGNHHTNDDGDEFPESNSSFPALRSQEDSWPPATGPATGDDYSVILENSINTTSNTSSAVTSPTPLQSPVQNSENKTSDVPALRHASATPLQSPVENSRTAREKFLVPLLSYQVGAGNQFMEYLSAAVIARSLNRTLCLSPFFPGPSRHTGRVTSGLAFQDRYDVSSLSRFTRVASLSRCLNECDSTLDGKWMLKNSREPKMGSEWKKYPGNKKSLNLKWDYVKWTTPEDIFATLGSHSARCVGMLGLFPGLRWRGAFLAISAFIRPAARINKLADALQQNALGNDTRFLAVHWRFEESECGGHDVGLCFVRCDDGAVIDSGLRPEAKEWHKAAETQCNRTGRFRGVTLDKQDIIEAIHERAVNHSVNSVYLATDGWMRGRARANLVKSVVESLRRRGLTVVGLWKLPGLPNFADGTYFDPVATLGASNQDLNGAQIALVEQELCARSVSFMGSGPSTFSLAVFRIRLARRRVEELTLGGMDDLDPDDSRAMDERIAAILLKDAHAAGLHCRYLRYMKRVRVNETVESYAEEFPDSWLDLEACEGRIGRGGRCHVAECF